MGLKNSSEELNGGKESAETEKTYIDGCKNIENITTKHKGSYTFYTENNTYTAIVSLPFSIS